MLTGRRASQSGYSKSHPGIPEFNPTLASVLKGAGYRTAALVDNPNVAAQNGYGKGFDRYRETWQEAPLATEMDRTHAITGEAVAFLSAPPAGGPFFLWLHYVNPHAPYTPPAPFDSAFLDAAAESGPRLKVVPDFHEGIFKGWAVPGKDRLGYYVAQYDGEVATVDREVGRVLKALKDSGREDKTVVLLTSDHGESLGEHGYFFDHGENLFDPCLEIPLIVRVPGGPAARRSAILASSLDVVPTVLDAVKVSYPPDLGGGSLLPAVTGSSARDRERLFAQNDRNLSATWNHRFKVVASPDADGLSFALFDKAADPGEKRDVGASLPDDLRVQRRELETLLAQVEREWARTRGLLEGRPSLPSQMTREACDRLRALGYVEIPGCPP